MSLDAAPTDPPRCLDEDGLDRMIQALAEEGFRVWGPVQRDGATLHEEVAGTADLARGWVEDQDGGTYRLRREGDAFFGHTTGPSPWKRLLHPPRQPLWRMEQTGHGPQITPQPVDRTRHALIGLRACDLAAIAVQDKVFLDGPYRDPHYAARREGLFLVAVNCGRAAKTCFCASMGTGPRVGAGHDIALTEIAPGRFLAEAGSPRGQALLSRLPSTPATAGDRAASDAATANALAQMGRKLDTRGLPDLLRANPDHPRWTEVADRCLNCGNCTMVCPTCFCTSVEDQSALDGSSVARESRWASCFTLDFSHVHGGPVRPGAKSRYRQWMTHKLATWVDQFDTSGCVGCGRCITWCPVGIDITEEAAAIRGTGGAA